MHFVSLFVQPFFECFLQLSILTSSSTAKIILDNFISDAGLSNLYPPADPLILFTSFLPLSFMNICSK